MIFGRMVVSPKCVKKRSLDSKSTLKWKEWLQTWQIADMYQRPIRITQLVDDEGEETLCTCWSSSLFQTTLIIEIVRPWGRCVADTRKGAQAAKVQISYLSEWSQPFAAGNDVLTGVHAVDVDFLIVWKTIAYQHFEQETHSVIEMIPQVQPTSKR